jgi:3-deoxy-D-manno-octulosonic-acid transferase
LKNKAVLFSKVDENTISNFQVLIIDSIGILSSLYQYGTLAYIGGGFGVGIHNILEAATFGLPVIFGPNHQKFQEAVDLIQHGGAFPISNQNELNTSFSALLNHKNRLENARYICKNYIEKNTGSTQIIIKKVFNILA